MENITVSEYENTEYVTIDKGNNEFTFMLKSVYDEQQKAAQQPTIDIPEPPAKK